MKFLNLRKVGLNLLTYTVCTSKVDADYSFTDELELNISKSVHSGAHLPDRPPKQPRIQKQI